MKHMRLSVFLVFSLLLICTAVTMSQQYNLPRQYSATQCQDGWFYYYGTPYNRLQLSYTNYVDPWGVIPRFDWNGGGRYLEFTGRDSANWMIVGPGDRSGGLQPGENTDITIGWHAPETGRIYISGMLNTAFPNADAASGNDDGVYLSIYHGDTLKSGPVHIFRGNNEDNRNPSATLNTFIDVNQNEFIYFYVNRGNWQDADGMYYSFNVSYLADADFEPPVSTHEFSGNQLQLSATDNESGVANIEYAIYYPTSEYWQKYTGPVTLPTGEYKIMYRAIDSVGNVEPYHRIDVTARRFYISGNVGDNTNMIALAGATVTARNNLGSSFSAVTNESGNYSIELPGYDGYYVSFKKNGYVPQWCAGEWGSQLESNAIQVYVGTEYDRPDSIIGINTALDRGGVIRGRTTRYGQGTPATINVYSGSNMQLFKNQHIKNMVKSVSVKMEDLFDGGIGPILYSGRTGENGMYEVPVVPSDYLVEFVPDTLPRIQWYNHKYGPPYDTVKVVSFDDTVRNINANFTPGRTTITGRVMDTSGTPLICKVVAYNWNDDDVLQVFTTVSNGRGYYDLPVPMGVYKVGFIKSKYIQVLWAGERQAYVPMNALSVPVGEIYQAPDSIANINGNLIRGAVVSGHTTLYNDPVMSDILVTNSEDESSNWYFYTRSNKNGDYELALPEGKWFMTFLRRGPNTTGPYDRRTIWYNQKVETPFDTLIVRTINDSLKNINAEFGLPPEMQAVRILSVKDVPNDQGKQVFVIWKALQRTIFSEPALVKTELQVPNMIEYPIVTAYSVLRKDGLVWTQVARLDPQMDSIYSAVVPTLFDSTKPAGIFWSKFKVTAHTVLGQPFYSSIRDSGYSIDNIAPIPPQGILASVNGSNVVIAWNAPPEEDVVVEYLVYRSTTPNFSIEGMEEYAKVKATTYEDVGAATTKYYYKVVAVDPSGNASSPSVEVSKSSSGVENANIKPTEFALFQNYPNPFNPSTSITYDLPDRRYVSLKIFNTLGQEVASLVNKTQSVGRYTVNFDARNLSTGLYIYRLTAGTSVSIMKMLLVK